MRVLEKSKGSELGEGWIIKRRLSYMGVYKVTYVHIPPTPGVPAGRGPEDSFTTRDTSYVDKTVSNHLTL